MTRPDSRLKNGHGPTVVTARMHAIVDRVCFEHDVTREDLARGSRSRRNAAARRDCALQLHADGHSLCEIRDAMGYRSHTSIWWWLLGPDQRAAVRARRAEQKRRRMGEAPA